MPIGNTAGGLSLCYSGSLCHFCSKGWNRAEGSIRAWAQKAQGTFSHLKWSFTTFSHSILCMELSSPRLWLHSSLTRGASQKVCVEMEPHPSAIWMPRGWELSIRILWSSPVKLACSQDRAGGGAPAGPWEGPPSLSNSAGKWDHTWDIAIRLFQENSIFFFLELE